MKNKFLPFRENKKIGILIDDFRILYNLINEITSWGFNFEFLNINEPIPKGLSIILTSQKALKSITLEKEIQIIRVSKDMKNVIISLLLNIANKKLFNQVIIGIDPGVSTGIAVIADGCILFAEVVSEVELVQRILELLDKFPAKSQIVKIGDGVISEQFFMSLFQQIPSHVVIQKVDESRSSKQLLSGSIILNKDQGAAIRIAKRKGTQIKFPPKSKISLGMIRETQNQSRKISGGNFTISRSLARRVCRGEFTINEAVRKFKNQLKLE
ncbi:MAG: hypothetical protein ACE5R6_06860 [Candidatus Heimdallarchaeota archaeon]